MGAIGRDDAISGAREAFRCRNMQPVHRSNPGRSPIRMAGMAAAVSRRFRRRFLTHAVHIRCPLCKRWWSCWVSHELQMLAITHHLGSLIGIAFGELASHSSRHDRRGATMKPKEGKGWTMPKSSPSFKPGQIANPTGNNGGHHRPAVPADVLGAAQALSLPAIETLRDLMECAPGGGRSGGAD